MKNIAYHVASIILILITAFLMHWQATLGMPSSTWMLFTIATALALFFPFTRKSFNVLHKSIPKFALSFSIGTTAIIAVYTAWHSSNEAFWWMFFGVLAIIFIWTQILVLAHVSVWMLLTKKTKPLFGILWLVVILIASIFMNISTQKAYDEEIKLYIGSIKAYAQKNNDPAFCDHIDTQVILREHFLAEISGCAEFKRFDGQGNPLPTFVNVAPKTLGDSYTNNRLIWKDLGFTNADPFYESCKVILKWYVDTHKEECRQDASAAPARN